MKIRILIYLCIGILWAVFYPFRIVWASENKIPEVIHYVWLGSKELPPEVQKSIQTWRKQHPDFQIKRWDETNCDINANHFSRINYGYRNFDLVSDWCRILALKEGGIYLDTDMRLNQPLTSVLEEPLNLTIQRDGELSASFMAVIPNHPLIHKIKEKYNRLTYGNINSPSVWSWMFSEYFKENEIHPKQVKNAYRIYPANLLMFDFKGGENIAEHLYASANPDINLSKWHHIYRQQFLEKFAYYIGDKNYYLITKDVNSGYFITNKTHEKVHDVTYRFNNGYLHILEPEDELFTCKDMFCKKQKTLPE